MISHIQSRELIKSREYVREPIDVINKKIKNTKEDKIILTGPRGGGKSTILCGLEDNGLGNNNQTIYTCFDSVILFEKNNEKYFDEDFKKEYYELIVCFKLLSYMRDNYGIIYKKYFDKIYIDLKKISEEVDKEINNACFGEIEIKRLLNPLETSSKIINKLKDILELDTLSLALDRFDWINGSDESIQKILSNYFNLFDKVILTTDDETLQDINNRNSFEKKGYSFLTIDYGKEKDVLKEIIKRRIGLYNELQGKKTIFKEEYITDKIYEDLIQVTNGNISLLLDIVREVADLCDWEERIDNVESFFATQKTHQLNTEKRLRKMSKPKKLYL